MEFVIIPRGSPMMRYICIHPLMAGKGLKLLDEIDGKINLKLIKTKTFGSGAIILYYEPGKKP